jgi:hypothetical protein
MIITMDKIKERKSRNHRINNLKKKLIKLDEHIEDFENLERQNNTEIKSLHTFQFINKNIKYFNINTSRRELALDILECAKNNNSLITYKNSLVIAEYIQIGHKKLSYKSFFTFLEFKIRINN